MTLLARLAAPLRRRRNPLREGQLDSLELELLVSRIAERESWAGGSSRIVVEVGTGGGKGSTVALHRALTAARCGFRLVGYEGDAELAGQAARVWSGSENVRVVDEYFMRREDVEQIVKPSVAPAERAAYLPVFDAVAAGGRFLETAPPGAVDLLFIDSVRYTHLAILRAARPWLTADTVVLMEDDIPGYGELALVESELGLRDVARHEIGGHLWPLVEFRLAL